MRRVGIYGWGLVAPRSANVAEFEANLAQAESWLAPFQGFGPANFLVGQPKFDFNGYRGWIEQRFPKNRFRQLIEKMDLTTLYAVAAYIQALEQNPGIEEAMQQAERATQVCVGTGLGALPTIANCTLDLYRAQRRWNRYWSHPERNPALARHISGEGVLDDVPIDPRTLADVDEREQAEDTWFSYWAERSSLLHEHLAKLQSIAALQLEGDIETGKLHVIREQQRRLARLKDETGVPDPPWASVSPNFLWNIANAPAAQITMLGKLTGASFAPVAACSTFSLSLKLGLTAIRDGEADFAVIGATDPPPHPLSVAAFYNARVLAADRAVSKPLSRMKGTHVAGGSVIWILGEVERCRQLGFEPLGLEPVSVGVSSDADHIITPSEAGPQSAIAQALESAQATPEELVTWDLHATATPGDYQEVKNLRSVLPEHVLISARKGTFGHGMGAGGGWELTAQYLGLANGRLAPTALAEHELHEQLRQLHRHFVFDRPMPVPLGYAGKLSMGIGGINACVISRSWSTPSAR